MLYCLGILHHDKKVLLPEAQVCMCWKWTVGGKGLLNFVYLCDEEKSFYWVKTVCEAASDLV